MADDTKSGWKTTEFWFALAATALSTAFATGVIPTEGPIAAIAAIAAAVLTSLGYAVSRGMAKSGGASVPFSPTPPEILPKP